MFSGVVDIHDRPVAGGVQRSTERPGPAVRAPVLGLREVADAGHVGIAEGSRQDPGAFCNRRARTKLVEEDGRAEPKEEWIFPLGLGRKTASICARSVAISLRLRQIPSAPGDTANYSSFGGRCI